MSKLPPIGKNPITASRTQLGNFTTNNSNVESHPELPQLKEENEYGLSVQRPLFEQKRDLSLPDSANDSDDNQSGFRILARQKDLSLSGIRTKEQSAREEYITGR